MVMRVMKAAGDEKKKWRMSLALIVALYSAAVIAGGMGVYAIFQYFAGPDHTVLGLILEHAWHVLVLGVLIYLLLYSVLRRMVVRPINGLCLKLYAIATGNVAPITLKTNVLEIHEMVEGINLMLAKMCTSPSDVSPSMLSADAEKLRSLAKRSNGLGQLAREQLIEIASRIDDVATVLRMKVHGVESHPAAEN